MNRSCVYLIALTLTSFLAVSCGSSSSAPVTVTPPTAPTPTPSPTPTPTGPTATVSIQPNASVLTTTAFAPNPANVAVGTTVMWTNSDSTSHTTTSDNGVWNSGLLTPGSQFSFTFNSAGTFTYHCTIHPGMVGTIVVQ